MNKLRKVFTVSVMLMTVLSMSVVVAPSASAAAGPGDLVKVDGASAVYYVGDDSRLYVFPNEDAYKSWYSDFSSVLTISATELNAFGAPKANITVRSGTKLIKRPVPTAPEVYAVEPGGVLRWIDSEETAKALYGNDWAKRVVDVVDSFFTNYSADNAKTDKVTATSYPAGSLVKFGSAADVYYIDADGMARMISSEAAFVANRFDWNNVVTATIAKPAAGAAISGKEAGLTNTASGATQGGITPGAGTGLSVALASDTQASTNIISDATANEYPQGYIPFTKVNFTASNDGPVTVKVVKFTRDGIASDNDLGTMYLYDGTTKLAEHTSFSDRVVTFSNSAGLFTVAAGQTKSITLRGDLARGSTSVAAGKTIGFDLVNTSAVSADGVTVSGSFPMEGNLMTTSQVSDLADVHFDSYTTYPATVKADVADKELWRFNLIASEQDVQLERLVLTMVGTIQTTDVQNIELEVGGVKVGETQAISDASKVTFDFATPVTITAGQTKTFVLRGDMMGGSGRTFKFTVQRSSDIIVKDANYGVYITAAKDAVDTAFGIIQPTSGSGISVDSGTLTVGVASDSPTGNIPDGATNITFAKFSFEASGEDVKVDSLTVTCNGSDVADKVDNLKLLLNGSQVGSTDTEILCDNTQTSAFTFSNTFVLSSGTTNTLSVVGDTTDTTVAAAATFAMSLAAGSGNGQGQITLTSISTTAQTGRTVTIASNTMTLQENTAFGDKSASAATGVAGASEVKIASFIVTAGSGEAVDMTQVVLQDDATSELGDNFQNLKLKNGTTQIGTTIGTLNSTTESTYTFTPSSAIRITAGQQYVIDVYADIKSSPADSATVLTPVVNAYQVLGNGVSTGSSANSTAANVSLQNAYIAANGNLTVTAASDTPDAQQLVMGATDVTLAKFKFEADASEDINITELYISDQVSSAATGTIKNLRLYDGDTQVGQAVNLSGSNSTTTYANAIFSGLSLVIGKSSNKIITVKADITSYDTSGVTTTGQTHKLAILVNRGGGSNPLTATGASSGQSITGGSLDIGAAADVDVTGNQMTLYRTKLSASYAADTPSGSSVGSDDQVVAKVVVTNSSNVGSYDATVESLNFAISQTGVSNTATRQLKIYKDTITAGNLKLTTTWVDSWNTNFGNTNITDAGFTDVVVSAGSSVTFIVTLDTQDAATDDKISINVDAGDIEWGDGVSTSVTSVDSLPLSPKTLTY